MKVKHLLCQVACWALRKQWCRSPRSCPHIGFCNFMGTRVSLLPSCLYLFNSTSLSSHISRASRSIFWFLLVLDQNSSVSFPQNPFSLEQPKTTLRCHSQAENPPPTPHGPENKSRPLPWLTGFPETGFCPQLWVLSPHSTSTATLSFSQFLETPHSLPSQGLVLSMSSAWNTLLPDLPQDTY